MFLLQAEVQELAVFEQHLLPQLLHLLILTLHEFLLLLLIFQLGLAKLLLSHHHLLIQSHQTLRVPILRLVPLVVLRLGSVEGLLLDLQNFFGVKKILESLLVVVNVDDILGQYFHLLQVVLPLLFIILLEFHRELPVAKLLHFEILDSFLLVVGRDLGFEEQGDGEERVFGTVQLLENDQSEFFAGSSVGGDLVALDQAVAEVRVFFGLVEELKQGLCSEEVHKL